jgi:threonine/homoserine/homoserine lactone efflux protein
VVVLRGFLVSLANPKTLPFYAAFFPQFVSSRPGTWDATVQVIALAATFLILAMLLDGLWAVLAGRMRRLLALRARLRRRLAGGLLIGAGVALALARKSRSDSAT